MKDPRIKQYYDVKYYDSGQPRQWIKLPFPKAGYYVKPLRLLDVQEGRTLLDIACGAGQLLKTAKALGLRCYGIDISEVAISQARKNVKGELVCANVDKGLPYDDNFFDYITCLGSLEHFENQSRVLREICRVAKSSCRIYFLVPNDNYILHRLGYETDFQPVINRHSLVGYRSLMERNGLAVYRTLRDNSHLTNLAESSSLPKLLVKLVFRPFVSLIPLHLSYNFIFLCQPSVSTCS